MPRVLPHGDKKFVRRILDTAELQEGEAKEHVEAGVEIHEPKRPGCRIQQGIPILSPVENFGAQGFERVD